MVEVLCNDKAQTIIVYTAQYKNTHSTYFSSFSFIKAMEFFSSSIIFVRVYAKRCIFSTHWQNSRTSDTWLYWWIILLM